MTVQDFREILKQQPFVPFKVVMSSGEAYEVRHPEMAWLTRTTLYVGIGTFREGIPSAAKLCSLLHVTAVEPINQASANGEN